jgi:hypothetical protein
LLSVQCSGITTNARFEITLKSISHGQRSDYTGADCSGWMKEAGFRETRVEHLVGPDSMVVGIK